MDFYHWFPEKYRLATRGLTPYQDGCYRRLIDEYMTTRRPLPASDAALADICRISIEQWSSNACSMLKAFFKEKNGLLFQENCDAELDRQDKTGKFRSERSKKAAEIRWNKNKELNAISIPEVMLQECLAMPELRVESKDIEDTNVSSNTPLPPKPENPSSEISEAVKLWNDLAAETGLSKIQHFGKTRQASLRLRLKEAGGLTGWGDVLEKIRQSDFLCGGNDRSWKADFDWVITQRNFTKILEGNYNNRQRKENQNGNYGRKKTWVDAGEELARKYEAEAERERQSAASQGDGAGLHGAEPIRQISGRTGNLG